MSREKGNKRKMHKRRHKAKHKHNGHVFFVLVCATRGDQGQRDRFKGSGLLLVRIFALLPRKNEGVHARCVALPIALQLRSMRAENGRNSRQRANGGLSIFRVLSVVIWASIGERDLCNLVPLPPSSSALAWPTSQPTLSLFAVSLWCPAILPPAWYPVPNIQSIGNRTWHGEADGKTAVVGRDAIMPDLDFDRSHRNRRIGKKRSTAQAQGPRFRFCNATPQNYSVHKCGCRRTRQAHTPMDVFFFAWVCIAKRNAKNN